MSYQVLARKWRPQNFTQMVGQQHVLRALINALEEQRLHHAYLFTGTRGVGKTTIARILVKCLNCKKGITATPCGECGSCVEIAEGRFVDLMEVDAASRTKVEDTRELLDNIHYAPTHGRFKVYLIDEVHMLSGHSFNALLKTLEEPPAHVKFLLATTDPQKLPATILSRCLQFNLKRMPLDLIQGHLQYLLQQESINFEVAALKPLARAADGSMRDALSLLDQAIAFGAGTLKADDVTTMLGTIAQDWLVILLTAIAEGDGKRLLDTVEEMAGQVADFEAAADSLISLLHQVALLQVVPDSGIDDESIQQLATRLTMEDVQLYYQIALNGRKDISLSPDPRSGLEMLLLRMMVFRPIEVASVVDKPICHDQTKKKPSRPAPVITPKADKVVQGIQETQDYQEYDTEDGAPPWLDNENEVEISTSFEPNSRFSPSNLHDTEPALLAPPASSEVHRSNKQVIPRPTSVINEHVAEPVVSSNKTEGDWHNIVPQLQLQGMLGQFANHCLLDKMEANTVFLLFDKEAEQLYSPTMEQELKVSLETYWQKSISLSLKMVAMHDSETPAKKAQRQQEEGQQHIEQLVRDDPFVQALQTKLGAEVLPGSIKPRKE